MKTDWHTKSKLLCVNGCWAHTETHTNTHSTRLNNAACECCTQRVGSIQIRHPVTFSQPPSNPHLHMHTRSAKNPHFCLLPPHPPIHSQDSDSMFHVATLSCHISFLSATLSPSLPLLYSSYPFFLRSPIPPSDQYLLALPSKAQEKTIKSHRSQTRVRARTCVNTHTDRHALSSKRHTLANTRSAMNMQVGLLDLQRQGEARWLHSSWDCHWIRLSPFLTLTCFTFQSTHSHTLIDSSRLSSLTVSASLHCLKYTNKISFCKCQLF